MIKRSTWFLLFLLVLVVGAYFFLKNLPTPSTPTTPTAQSDVFLFNQTDGNLDGLQIIDANNNIIRMQRDTMKTWMVMLPASGMADQSLATAAETQVNALLIVTKLDHNFNLVDAGLDQPAYTITLNFSSGVDHKLDIGMLTPTNSGYYVRYDDQDLFIISRSGIDALLNLLTSPPYSETLTPFPTIVATVTPTLFATTPTP